MSNRNALKILFVCIFLCMLAVTVWASLNQALQNWTGLTQGADRFWTTATFFDAYCGFLTFYVWVCFKERRAMPRILWFLAIMLLGNMAMAFYVLLQLLRLRSDENTSRILVARNP